MQGIELALRREAQTVIVRHRRSGYFGDGSKARIGRRERQVAERRGVVGIQARVLARLMHPVIANVVECNTALCPQWLLHLKVPLFVLRSDNAMGSVVKRRWHEQRILLLDLGYSLARIETRQERGIRA